MCLRHIYKVTFTRNDDGLIKTTEPPPQMFPLKISKIMKGYSGLRLSKLS